MITNGAYEGVYEIRGNLRAYVGKAVTGGRCHVNTKYLKQVIEGQIADYDAVSCYPSAIKRLCDVFRQAQHADSPTQANGNRRSIVC